MNFAFLEPYIAMLPELFMAFALTLLLTPVAGYIGKRFGFIDTPQSKRPRSENARTLPRIGGLAVMFSFLFVVLLNINLTPPIWGMLIGLLILMISGAIDDKYELSSSSQFFFQFLAASITVIAGTTITFIQVAGVQFDLNMFSHEFFIGDFIYNFIFPADLFTIFWIILIINALNWVFGIDALGEGITIIAAITIMLISVKTGRLELALVSGVLAASLMGYFPYNYPPAKIISGTIGTSSYGFLIAVMAILSGAKISSAVLLLTLPLLDMVWVIIYRMKHYKNIPLLHRPFQRGRIHLHHRIMSAGYTVKETLVLEMSIMAVISVVSFYLAGFGVKLLTTAIMIAIILSLTVLIIIYSKKKREQDRQKRIRIENQDDPPPPIEEDIPPEEKYAY